MFGWGIVFVAAPPLELILLCYLSHAVSQVVRYGVNGIDHGWNYVLHDQVSQVSNNYYKQLYLVNWSYHITNIPHNVVATGVLPTPEVSDHDMPYVIVNARLSRFETRFEYIRSVKSFCSDEYLRDISELPFSLVYAVDDPDEKITILNE
jgi:hypothetical protein